MKAIDLLMSQHREVEDLFSKIEKAKSAGKKTELFEKLADDLAIHAAIEEHHFYPAVKDDGTEDNLLDVSASDETFDAKIKVLKEQIEHHVEEEEGELFPRAKQLLNEDEMEALGQAMSAEQAELEEKGQPRENVLSETDAPASI